MSTRSAAWLNLRQSFSRWMFLAFAAGLALAWVWPGCAPAKPPVAQPADADGDGIPDDGTDKCLNEKEDGLPPDPKDGCKSTDPDGDGIIGDADKCPKEKEDGLPPDPKDGCASVDTDGDGLIGATDQCPNEPETKNGYQDADGCPDTPRVVVTKTEVKITEKIMFAFGKATIEPASQSLLDEIAYVVNDNPQIEYLEVAGHADKIGTEPFNVQLTKRRAQAVMAALVKRQVDPRRMHAQGYGNYCNSTVQTPTLRARRTAGSSSRSCASTAWRPAWRSAASRRLPRVSKMRRSRRRLPRTPSSPSSGKSTRRKNRRLDRRQRLRRLPRRGGRTLRRRKRKGPRARPRAVQHP